MKIPKKVRVAGHTYKVQWENERLGREHRSGDSHHGTHVIGMSDRCHDGQLADGTEIEDTFIHEILHCVDTQYNHGALTEEQVVRLSTGLHQVLGDLGWLPRVDIKRNKTK